MPHAAALESLQSIPGVGPWTAQLILTRGTGPCDAVPDSEPRLAEALGRAFELHAPPAPGAIAGLLERFRPYRMWASVALVRHGFSLNRAEAATAGRTARKRGSGRRADASPPRGT
jgi:DNA-3-methyladenine glycosylase II